LNAFQQCNNKIAELRKAAKFERTAFELDLVKADLEVVGNLSPKVQNTIIEAINNSASRFKIPIGLLHGVFRIESDYRFYLNHPTVTIGVKGKQITTYAIGLGGVIWECWEDTLKKYKIAETRTDLYIPETAVLATACILRSIINDELPKSNSYTLMGKIVRRYYGAYSEMYLSKMQEKTSDLWLKRMTMEILKNY